MRKIKSRRQKKQKKTIWRILLLIGICWLIFNFIANTAAQTVTITVEREHTEATQTPEIEPYDPCGLEVVYCEGEERPEPQKAKLSVDDIKKEIVATFPEDPDTALAIAQCESGYKPEQKGDGNLKVVNDETGEIVGDSIGIFQVRTGGKDWNRAARNGMTADQFREEMHDPVKNIAYAREIYERRGWSGWHNCAMRVGAYN